MTKKLVSSILIIFILWICLWSQQTNYLAQKIAIENSYRDKISSAVSQFLGQEKFLVIVNVEFSTAGGVPKKTADLQSGQDSQRGTSYIPGLPTVPSTQGTPSTYGSKQKGLSSNDYDIGRVEVNIALDEALATGIVNTEIKNLVEKIIPETKDCDDCIKIETMQFQSSQKNQKLEDLENQIAELEKAKRDADLAADAIRLTNLESQLSDAQNARDNLETMANRRELQNMEEDAKRFAQLVAAEDSRKEQDSIRFINTEKRLERVMESKIKSDSVIISEAMSIMKQQSVGGDNKNLLGMQDGDSGSGIMVYVIIILVIICFMILAFFASSNKKPNPVYLKPKEKDEKGGKDKKNSDKKESEDNVSEKSVAAPPPPRPDEDAMRSDIRALRQTAVSLTVGEKEGASTLIKEWLDDNPNKKDEGGDGSEETEGE